MTETKFDVIVLGGGPGGYLAAERLGNGGKKVLLIEEKDLGGTCLTVGCIPTKTLLNSAKHYVHASEAGAYGVGIEGASYDWEAMQKWKGQVVKGLVGGVGASVKKAGCTVVYGRGYFEGPGKVRVDDTHYTAEHVIIATGSVPAMPPIPGSVDNEKVVDSTGLLSISDVPKRLAVIGGGVIGVEFASLFSSLGSEVTVVEMMDEILPFMDDDMAAQLRKAMPAITFNLGCKVEAVEGPNVVFSKDGQKHTVEADLVLMAVGRRPATRGWGAEESGLDIGRRGITVDDRLRTNLPNVWAIGDVTGRSLLAHAAYRMGEVVAANILDDQAYKRGQVMRWNTIPWAVYCLPEAAGVGLTESKAKAEGRAIKVGSVPGQMSGRFIAENGFKAPGSAKVIVDAETNHVLGIHVLGTYASEMIWGACAVLETELTLDDLRQLVVPHPTVSELIREAAWAVKA
ncbi:MAG: dihydrolipoyl dehydrogenase [Actinomyces sp.]|nr:dihydrolipoyl dehydrogenase [Actinomyces sp.]